MTHDGPSVCQQSFGLVSNKQRIYLLSLLAVIFMLIKKDIWNSGNKVALLGVYSLALGGKQTNNTFQ